MSRTAFRSRRAAGLAAVVLASSSLAVWTLGAVDVAPPVAGVERDPDAIAVAADAITASGADRRDEVAAVHGCYGAPAGSRFQHRIDDRATFRIAGTEAGTHEAGALHGRCSLQTTVLARREREVLVEYQLVGLEFVDANGKPITDAVQQSFAVAAATAVVARLDDAGRVLGYGFAGELDGDQRNFLRGMLATVAFAAPRAGTTRWDAQEADTTGDYDARYDVLPAAAAHEVAVRRTKLRYRTVAACGELPAHEVRGGAEARFRTDLGWLASARLREGMTMALPMLDLQSISERRVDVDFVGANHVAVTLDVAAAWAAATAPVSGRHETVGGFAAASERDRWQQLLRGVTLDQLLAELTALLAQSPADDRLVNDVFVRMQWLAKLDDAVAKEIGARVATRQLGGDPAGVALSSLGAAGTAAAQATLVAVRADRSLAVDVRNAATVATLQLAQPTAAVVQGLADDAGSDFDGRQGSMLVLGALAPRAGQPLADGRSPLATLLAMEADAVARGDVATWLLAVGNAAPPETVAIAQRYLGHADAAVRGAACVALRRITGEQALTLLVERSAIDADASVRREAMLALSRRVEAAAREALQRMAAQDPDELLRERAGQLLLGA
jgi:hypothetical protein